MPLAETKNRKAEKLVVAKEEAAQTAFLRLVVRPRVALRAGVERITRSTGAAFDPMLRSVTFVTIMDAIP